MTVRKIVTFEDPRLRKRSIRVKKVDQTIHTLINDMLETMREANGVGLAAPQIGILLRLLVAEFVDDETEEIQQQVLINPEITAREGEWMAEEGCLSIPGYVGTVPRAEKITVRGQDRDGKRIKINADGYLAHILQHEIDHLEGTLYVDYLEKGFDDLRLVEPGEKRRRRRAGASLDGDDVDSMDDEGILEEPAGQRPDAPPAANDGDPGIPAPGAAEEAGHQAPSPSGVTPEVSASPGGPLVPGCFDPCCGSPIPAREHANPLNLS
jgi:peptide deformylase